MIKKINSEYKVNNTSPFTVTMGTANKKNPEVIYSVLSTYITPNTDEIDESIFDIVSKNTKKSLKNSIMKYGLCENNIIVVSDVAANRMLKGKQSYFDMQIYFKPQKNIPTLKNKKFKDISDSIYNTYVKNIVSDIESTLKTNGFTMSKNKNNRKKEIVS
jgi:hypothetical protein